MSQVINIYNIQAKVASHLLDCYRHDTLQIEKEGRFLNLVEAQKKKIIHGLNTLSYSQTAA